MQSSDSRDVFDQDVGAELARAREARGLTRARVAEELRLSQSHVEALERGDRDRLPEITYVRGYVRAYARLVGLDADEMVQRFERSEPGVAQPRRHGAKERAQPAAASSSRRLGVSARDVMVVVALAAIAVPWYLLERSLETRPAPGPVATVDAGAAPAPAAAMQPGFAGDDEGLVLRLLGPSWVTVIDGRGERLVHGHQSPGEILALQGTPPFAVFLGNARAVDLEYYGRAVDVPLRRESLYARLRVEGTAVAGMDD